MELLQTYQQTLGMGLYMITDDSYSPIEGGFPGTEEVEKWKESINEPGVSVGIKYHMNNIGVGISYEIY